MTKNKGENLKKVETNQRDEIIRELKELGVRAVHGNDYENMPTNALELKLRLFKIMSDKADKALKEWIFFHSFFISL